MVNEHGRFMDSRTAGTPLVVSGCVVRFDSRRGYPRVHANEAHVAVGVKNVYVNDYGHLEIDHEGGPVVTLWCSPDETLVGKGLRFGASGGAGITVVKTYDERERRYLDLNVGRDWLKLHDPWANLWVGWVHAIGRPSAEEEV